MEQLIIGNLLRRDATEASPKWAYSLYRQMWGWLAMKWRDVRDNSHIAIQVKKQN
jgi:hypothetical protein